MASIRAPDEAERRGPGSFFPPPPSKKDFMQPQSNATSVPSSHPATPSSSSAAASTATPGSRKLPTEASANAAVIAGKHEDHQSEAWAHFSDVDSDTGLISGAKRPDRTAGSECSNSSSAGRGGQRSGSTTSDASDSVDEEALIMTDNQREYYCKQFLQLCGGRADAKMTGQEAKQYFEKSQLPSNELAQIWAAADADKDGCLNLNEFCSAMHLVVLRRHKVPLSACLPSRQYERLDDTSPVPSVQPQQQQQLQQQQLQQQQLQQQQQDSEPAVFGGIPPSSGVVHPTPRKPTMLVEQLAPTVPPRSTRVDQATAVDDNTQQPLTRERLLTSVKMQKEKNHMLVRLNNELAQELKEVTEQRIALELELQRVKPLS